MFNFVTNDLSCVLQQENARPHTATYTRDCFMENHVVVMEWPGASADLIPKENVWQIMKDRVEKISLTILQSGK
jgi:tRNA A37 threonylcarbamoyladenosine biosynthesis protein TsaE